MSQVDFVDIAMDACAPHHYKESEDLANFTSTKTSRGPLQEGWREDTQPIMCRCLKMTEFQPHVLSTLFQLQACWCEVWHDVPDAVEDRGVCTQGEVDEAIVLVRNKFKMQSIREILLVGHRQAFAWIDEWFGMSLQDVRDYENRMQEETNEKVKMAGSAPPTPQPLEEEAGGSAYGTPASTPTSPTGGSQKRGWFSWPSQDKSQDKH